MPATTWEHQPRERAVPCRECRGKTFNEHLICNWCIDKGAPIACHAICAEVARAHAARQAVPA